MSWTFDSGPQRALRMQTSEEPWKIFSFCPLLNRRSTAASSRTRVETNCDSVSGIAVRVFRANAIRVGVPRAHCVVNKTGSVCGGRANLREARLRIGHAHGHGSRASLHQKPRIVLGCAIVRVDSPVDRYARTGD